MCGVRPYGAEAYKFVYAPHIICVWCINERAVGALKHAITIESLWSTGQAGRNHVTINDPGRCGKHGNQERL